MITLFALSLLTPIATNAADARALARFDLADRTVAEQPPRDASRYRMADDPAWPADERPRFRLRGTKVKMWMPI